MWRWASRAKIWPGREQAVRQEELVVGAVAADPRRRSPGCRPKRGPMRPLSERNTSTVVACPDRIAATAWPTMAARRDAARGRPRRSSRGRRRPSAWTRSLVSNGVACRSARCRRCRRASDRRRRSPRATPRWPASARCGPSLARSRWRRCRRWRSGHGDGTPRPSASPPRSFGSTGPATEDLDGVLAEQSGPGERRGAVARRTGTARPDSGPAARRRARPRRRTPGPADARREQIVGRVDRTDRQTARLALVVGLLGRLQQEEDLDHSWMWPKLRLAVRGIVVRRVERGRRRGPCCRSSRAAPATASGRPRRSRSRPTARRRTGRAPAGSGVGWAWRHVCRCTSDLRVEPVRVGQLGVHGQAVVHADVDQLAPAGRCRSRGPASGP